MVIPVYVAWFSMRKVSLLSLNSLSNAMSFLMDIYHIHLLSSLLDCEVYEGSIHLWFISTPHTP